MARDDATAVPDPQVVCTELRNGEGVLLHLGTQCYFTLNPTGLVVWRLMEQGMKLGAIGGELAARKVRLLRKAHALLRARFGFYFSTLQVETDCLDEDHARDLDISTLLRLPQRRAKQ